MNTCTAWRARASRLGLLLVAFAGCGGRGPGIDLELTFDSALKLDQLLVTVESGAQSRGPRRYPEPASPLGSSTELRLMIPDDWGGSLVRVSVTGVARGSQVVSGAVGVPSLADDLVRARLALVKPGPPPPAPTITDAGAAPPAAPDSGPACLGCTPGQRRCVGPYLVVCTQSAGICRWEEEHCPLGTSCRQVGLCLP